MARLAALAALAAALLPAGTRGDGAGAATTATTTTTPVMKYYEDVVASLPPLTGKCVAITGTTSGIGYWAAAAAAKKAPACIVMLNRMSSRAVQAEQDIKKLAGPGVEVVTVTCDLQNLSSVREAAVGVSQAVAKFGGLDVLALNAGIMQQPDVRTHDGYDVMMQTNHLSHFLLTKLLMPTLEAAVASRGESRVVTESSLARSSLRLLEGGGPVASEYYLKSLPGALGGNGSDATKERYHQSKVANLAFAMALHARLAAAGKADKLKALSSAPGFADTHLDLPKVLQPEWIKHLIGLSAPDGSCSMLLAMFAPSAQSGDFYEPTELSTGKPLKVIAAGAPLPPAFPRPLLGIHDKDLCAASNLDKVWASSEQGLGIKWVVGGPAVTLV